VFLMAAGALAGYFPARAAARINPIHALRDQ
jgi:ABC-type antimicrobial peptide transport system permease subunit